MEKLKKHKKKIIIAIVIIAIILIFAFIKSISNTSPISSSMVESKVTKGNLDIKISSEGVIKPYERYEIMPLVTGEILTCPFEEGDTVKKDDILYTIDCKNAEANLIVAQNNLAVAKISHETATENINNLNIRATQTGYLSNFNLEVGDSVMANTQVGIITNNEVLTIKVTFNENQIQRIHLGQMANITIADYMSQTTGTVTYISNTSRTSTNGMVYDVEITLKNPGIIENGTKATITIPTETGVEKAITEGIIKINEKIVIAKSGGEVLTVYAKNNQKVMEGEILATIKNDAYQKAYQQSVLNINSLEQALKNAKDLLDNYSLKSPIDGVIITKTNKAGDKVGDKVVATPPLMVVADMTKMKFTMEVDELDIVDVLLGQKVQITADALKGKNFIGTVTKIPAEGIATNGITTYTVEIEVEEYEGLRTGMNVDADIIIEQLTNVLIIPMAAVTEINGTTYAYVKNDGKKASESVVYNNDTPSGYRLQKIEVGASNNDYIEVKSGLKEGDTVYSMLTSNSNFMKNMTQEMMGLM